MYILIQKDLQLDVRLTNGLQETRNRTFGCGCMGVALPIFFCGCPQMLPALFGAITGVAFVFLPKIGSFFVPDVFVLQDYDIFAPTPKCPLCRRYQSMQALSVSARILHFTKLGWKGGSSRICLISKKQR